MDNDFFQIIEQPINIGTVYERLSGCEYGAQLVFTGVVRNENQGQGVYAVTYEVFKPLAERIFEDIAGEVREKIKSSIRIVIMHRVGKLKVGEVSTVVGVASAHREESYEASRYLIEQLKVRAPIWKEEHYVDDKRVWLDGTELTAKDSCCDSGRWEVIKDG